MFKKRRLVFSLLFVVLLVGSAVAPIPTHADTAITVRARQNLHLRSAPSPYSDSLTVVPRDTIMTAQARDAFTVWILVSSQGMSGWLYSGFLDRSACLDLLQVYG